MKVKEIYICENCDETFESQEECQKHEFECKCKSYLPVIYCYWIDKREIPISHRNLHYYSEIFSKAELMEDGSISLWDTNKQRDMLNYLSNYLKNIYIIKNNDVIDNGRNVCIFSFDNSVENTKKCLQKLIDYRINEFTELKKEYEENIESFKNCNIDIKR